MFNCRVHPLCQPLLSTFAISSALMESTNNGHSQPVPVPIPIAPSGSSNPTVQTTAPQRPASADNNLVGVLGNLLKVQTGEHMSNEKISNLLLSNMENLVKQGKLNQTQILQVLSVQYPCGPDRKTRKRHCLLGFCRWIR